MADINDYFKSASFNHVCALVKDLKKTIKSLKMLPDNGPWEIKEYDYSKEIFWVGPMYKVKVAFGQICGVNYEIAEPIPDPEGKKGVWNINYIKDHGEGFHHIAYRFTSEEEYDEVAEKMIHDGFNIVMKCDLHREKGTPSEHRLKVHLLQPKAGGMVFEISVQIPVIMKI